MSEPCDKQLYIVRLYDGFDREWIDVSDPVSKERAAIIWNKATNNGEEKTRFNHINYYKVFEADTKMLFGGDEK